MWLLPLVVMREESNWENIMEKTGKLSPLKKGKCKIMMVTKRTKLHCDENETDNKIAT
jgi:hypothetical protein